MKTSFRGKLVVLVTKQAIKENMFEQLDKLENAIQKKLNENLKFHTLASVDITENGFSYGNVSFRKEDDGISIMNFTVISGGAIVIKTK